MRIFLIQIPHLADTCATKVIDEDCPLADPWSMVLSNISRPHHLAENVFVEIESKIEKLITAFTRIDYNKKKCHLNYLGNFNTTIFFKQTF